VTLLGTGMSVILTLFLSFRKGSTVSKGHMKSVGKGKKGIKRKV
jgi:hypothetical protein